MNQTIIFGKSGLNLRGVRILYDILNVYLENGLRVILHRVSYSRTMACGVWVKQGSMHENDEMNGISHLLEHLMINIDNKNNHEFCKLMKEVSNEGVRYNAGTTKETTSFYFTGLSKNLDICLKTLASIFVDKNSFPVDLLENEKKVVKQEIVSFYSSFNQIKERTSQALWGNLSIGRIIVGDIKNVENATNENLSNIKNEAYTPENATLVVVGGMDYEETLKKIEEYFGNWQDRETRQYKEVVDSEPGIYLNCTDNGNSSVVSVGFRVPSYTDGDRINIEILSKILGDPGLESKLVKEIRMKRGLAYNVGAFTSFYENRGTLGFTAVCSHESVEEVIKVMMNEFHKSKSQGFTYEEINKAKKILETSTLLGLDNLTAQLKFLGKCSSYGQLFSLEQELRNVRKINKDNIDRVTREIFNEENMGLAAIGNINIDSVIQLLNIEE